MDSSFLSFGVSEIRNYNACILRVISINKTFYLPDQSLHILYQHLEVQIKLLNSDLVQYVDAGNRGKLPLVQERLTVVRHLSPPMQKKAQIQNGSLTLCTRYNLLYFIALDKTLFSIRIIHIYLISLRKHMLWVFI